MLRLTFALSCCLTLASVVGSSSVEAASLAAARPNFVFIITDDQGYGDLSAHGNPILKTPNLDRLHAEGVRFTDFHVSPTCSPTRSALMSGRHEFRNGVTHTILERERMALDVVTLPQTLKTAGYATGIFGKWHLGDEAEYQPNRRGFDEVFIHGGGGIGQTYPGSCGDAPNNSYFDPAILHNGKFEKTKGYCTDVFFAQAQTWIESRVQTGQGTAKQPFFCYIATNAPHGPLQVRPEDEARYSGQTPSADVAKFFGMVANIDDNVGRLLAKLAELGLERNTLVVFMNDNGGTVGTRVFNAGMHGQKGTPYRGGTRAMSLWRWPNTLSPASCDRTVAHIDVYRTLAEIAGAKLSAKAEAQAEGRSLVSLLENPSADWQERTLFTHQGRWPKGSDANLAKFANCSIRSGRWNLVSTAKTAPRGAATAAATAATSVATKAAEPRWELYDLSADPGETKNLAAEHPEVIAELWKTYDRWWADVVPATLENERAEGPAINPFHATYYKQFGGSPAAGKDAKPTTAVAQAPLQVTNRRRRISLPNRPLAPPRAEPRARRS
ncbi:MAG: arylsulfatase [Pirellulales bacterium]